jgi:hypothetical protein
MKAVKTKGLFLTLFLSSCIPALSLEAPTLKEVDVTSQESIALSPMRLSLSLPDPKAVFAQYPLYQRDDDVVNSQQLPYADQIFLRDKSSITKIMWKGPESILPYLQEGPTYDVVEVYMNFEQDELSCEFFEAVLNLSPKVLTIFNNSKGVAPGFNITALTSHVNFSTLEELNFGYCYKLQPFFQTPEVASKIRRLTWGALSPDTIQDAVPEELANVFDVKEMNFGGVLVGEDPSLVLDRLKIVLANKSDLEIFAADFIWIDLLQWLNLIPPSISLRIMDVSGVYFNDGSVSFKEKCAAEAEVFVHLKQQDALTTFKLVHYRSHDWQNFGNSLISYLPLATHLRHLYLVGLTLTSSQWQGLGIGLGYHRQLQTLAITQSNMDSEACPFMSLCLINNPSLTRLSLSDNKQLSPLDGLLLLMAISSRKLTHLDMNHCLDIDRAKSSLVKIMSEQQELESLSILSDQIEVNDMIDLMRARNNRGHPLKLYVGSGTAPLQFSKLLAPMILEQIRKGEILPEGGMMIINIMPYDLSALQNYLFFSNRTRARITLYSNPSKPIVPINVDNSQAIIQGVDESSHPVQPIEERSSTAIVISTPLSSLSPTYSWYNPLAYAYNPLNLLWKR